MDWDLWYALCWKHNKCVVGVFGGAKDDWHSRAFGADPACAGLR